MSKKQKRIKIAVRWAKGLKKWTILRVNGPGDVQEANTKQRAESFARDACHFIAKAGGLAQLVVYKKDGKIEHERMYP